MAEAKKSAVREILEDPAAGRLDFLHACTVAYSVPGEMDKLKKLAADLEAASASAKKKRHAVLQAGVARWIMRQYADACAALDPVKNDKDGAFVLGLCQTELADYDAAIASFRRAAKAGQDSFTCGMAEAEAQRRAGRREEALAVIRSFKKSHADEAELHYQKGRCLEEAFDYGQAAEAYERAAELNPQHAGALFRLGYWNDLRGNDETAIEYYEKAAAIRPVQENTLLNLGMLYEDHGQYEKAAALYDRVLISKPTAPRAKMYYKDATESLAMYYDEALERRQSRTAVLLRTPLNEFELSARARTCLEQMDVRTVGDLASLKEDDLANSKNLGETSLAELRTLLRSRGLHFGMGSESSGSESVRPRIAVTEGGERLSKAIADMDFSIRCLKCMQSLGVQTVGDLVQKTEKELLKCQNFGQTSLAEIKNKLSSLGLSLKSRG